MNFMFFVSKFKTASLEWLSKFLHASFLVNFEFLVFSKCFDMNGIHSILSNGIHSNSQQVPTQPTLPTISLIDKLNVILISPALLRKTYFWHILHQYKPIRDKKIKSHQISTIGILLFTWMSKLNQIKLYKLGGDTLIYILLLHQTRRYNY